MLSLNELAAALAFSSRRDPFSCLMNTPFLLIDLSTANTLTQNDMTGVRTLSELPCPSIGILPDENTHCVQAILREKAPALCDALDIICPARDVYAILRNIQKHPLSALILVQLLRHNETCSINQGLFAESVAYATLQASTEFRTFLNNRQTQTQAATPQSASAVLVELSKNNKTLTITLNRPEYRNAYNAEMRDALVNALHLLSDAPSIESAIIKGAGDCFCSGGDLDEFGLATDAAIAHAIRSTRHAGQLINQYAEHIECHVHRACIGSGIELPAFASKLIATENTFFQLPEIAMGLIPGAGGTVSITRRIGRQRMAWWALSAKRINATTALEWGLIDAIEPVQQN